MSFFSKSLRWVNFSNKFIKNEPESWERTHKSGAWDFLETPVQKSRHYLISGLLKDTFPKQVSILDVGCGLGTLVKTLEGTEFHYTGIDVAETAIAKCRQRFSGRSDTVFHAMSFEQFQTSERFDAVVFNEVLYYFPLKSLPALIQKAENLLKAEESLLIISMNKNLKATFVQRALARKWKPMFFTRLTNPLSKSVWAIHAYTKDGLTS